MATPWASTGTGTLADRRATAQAEQSKSHCDHDSRGRYLVRHGGTGVGLGRGSLHVLACCLIPSTVYSFVSGIMMIVQGVLLLGNHPRRHLQRTRWTASLQIGCLLAADIPNFILGILNHMFLGDDAVKAYQNQVKPESK